MNYLVSQGVQASASRSSATGRAAGVLEKTEECWARTVAQHLLVKPR
jgi:hypothetical protein